MAPTTQKALILESKQGQFKVTDVDVPTPGPGEILVKTAATALNHIEGKIQAFGIFIEQYPAILGMDASGAVEALGEGVTNFKIGDRIVTQGHFNNRNATFQQYFIATADISAKVPDNVSFDEAASVPLGLLTAALGLFNQGTPERSAGLTPAWEEGGEGKYAGQPLLVLGGSSSVGRSVIQLGRLAGFSPIIATASPHNSSVLKALGATHVLDRALSGAALAAAVQEITSHPISVVYDTVSNKDTQNAGFDVLAPGGTLVITQFDAVDPAKKTADKRVAHVFGSAHPPPNRKLGQSLYGKLAELLEKGLIQPSRVEVLKDGLEGIPGGLERLKRGEAGDVKLIVRPQETA